MHDAGDLWADNVWTNSAWLQSAAAHPAPLTRISTPCGLSTDLSTHNPFLARRRPRTPLQAYGSNDAGASVVSLTAAFLLLSQRQQRYILCSRLVRGGGERKRRHRGGTAVVAQNRCGFGGRTHGNAPRCG